MLAPTKTIQQHVPIERLSTGELDCSMFSSYHLTVKSRNSFAILLLALVWVLSGACYGQAASDDKHSDFLVVVSGGTNPIFVNYSDGRQQVTYLCDAAYPAADVLAYIPKELEVNDWKPLKHDFLNPGSASSHVSGWTDFEDGTKHPSVHVFQWVADWEDEAHDVVRYGLDYRSPVASTRDLRALRVVALYIPAQIVTEMKEAVAAEMEKQPPAPPAAPTPAPAPAKH